MIPKIIQYCWFGKGEKPELVRRCIASWHRFMPEWTYMEWNEENFDIASAPLYVQQAYEARKYAFVSDYVRLWALEQYDRKTEQLFRDELGEYDVVVNAILWDTSRKDHIVYREDLKRMKKGALIIDLSCDRNGGIETSVPTTIDDPIYVVDGITHYVVDHTPSLFYKSTSDSISEVVVMYLDQIIEDQLGNTLRQATNIKDGVIVDERIKVFQGRE